MRLLRRVRDYAQVVIKTNDISVNLIKKALNSYQIDEKGLDVLDRKYLSFLNRNYNVPTGQLEHYSFDLEMINIFYLKRPILFHLFGMNLKLF